MKRLLLAVFCLALLLTSSAQASLVLDGSTRPHNFVPGSGLEGVVNAAVYSLTGTAADPYGAGVSTATLVASGFTLAGVDPFLYLYQTVNTGTLEISQNTVAWTPTPSVGQLVGKSFSPSPIVPGAVAGDPAAFFAGGAVLIVADGSAVSVSSAIAGPTSLQASYGITGLLPGLHSDVWGYTSVFSPHSGFTSVQDGGTSAEGIVPVGVVPVPAAIWGGLGLLGALFTAKVTRRRQA